MSATYWIARYTEDVFRNEPRNVGVIVKMGGIFAARFVGERDDGKIDERKLRGFAYPAAYTQWRDFWRRKLLGGDVDAITRAVTPNFAVEFGGEVTDELDDSIEAVRNFLYDMLVGGGPGEAFRWTDGEEAELDLASEISAALEHFEILAPRSELFARHPVIRNGTVLGKHVAHMPSFSQRNGRLYLMEHIDFSVRRANKTKERAGWMAYMFSDVKLIEPTCVSYSLIRPECENHSDQIEYARSVLAGESKIINWSDEAQRNEFIAERRHIADAV